MPNVRPTALPKQLPSLDGFRTVAIAIVFASHAGFSHLIPGGFGVTLFFFLSGFLITTLLQREISQTGTLSLPRFFLRRVVRLWPPLLVTLLIGVFLVTIDLAQGALDWGTLLSQIFFYYNYYSLFAEPTNSVDGFGIFWSLSVEEHFYLLWPSVFLLLHKRIGASRILAMILVATLVWRVVRFVHFQSSEWEIYISTDTRIDALLFGCLLAILQANGAADRLFKADHFKWVWLGAAVILLLLTFAVREPAFRSTLRYSLQGLALMPVFHYAVTQPDTRLFKPLNLSWISQIGVWSYTLYLVHYLIIKALEYNGLASHGSPALVLGAAALSLAYAALMYRIVERPMLPLRRKLAPKG
ncbi:MAG: acyltransferase [Shimia thalassica]|uniref:acyltransferase family protein n=1 Tax=Shimia thalassica TaxID=1715693 RepID=UPI003299EF7A